MDASLCNEVLKTIKAVVPAVKALYLFGSRAGGAEYATKHSDFDLAFYASHKPSLNGMELFNLRNQLANILNVDSVDLVDVGASDDHVLQQNIIDGTLIWFKQGYREQLLEWEAKRLTMANDWWEGEKELREEYISRLKRRIA